MAKVKQIFLLFNVLISLLNYSQIKVGANKVSEYLPMIQDKNVAFIANQTSMINNTHLIDSMVKLDVIIKKIFCPEHGFRGTEDAGAQINNSIDPITGIEIISLYGKNKKPTKNQLKDIEIIVFDIQDVGVRFYTYISTLHYVMEACSENEIQIIVLDRPNPNGHYIDGPILEKELSSFVGMHPVPIVHGMTIGEYAKMINGEKWIPKKCDLSIIKMDNYTHSMSYHPPIKPSPNLPNSKAINLYPSLCLFEGTNVSVGRGTKFPFQHFGSPYMKSTYYFTPVSTIGSKNPKHKNINCFGTDLRFTDIYLTSLNLNWILDAYHQCPEKNNFFNNFFDKLAGTKQLRKQIVSGKSMRMIKESWEQGLVDFKKKRKKYLLYK